MLAIQVKVKRNLVINANGSPSQSSNGSSSAVNANSAMQQSELSVEKQRQMLENELMRVQGQLELSHKVSEIS